MLIYPELLETSYVSIIMVLTSLSQLPAAKSTYGNRIPISADTEVNIPGFYIDADFCHGETTDVGAPWVLRQEGTHARVRDLVIV
jgi:hypothetical protein